MAMALNEPERLRGKRPKMTNGQLNDFASTPLSGLPMHAPDKPVKRNSYRRKAR